MDDFYIRKASLDGRAHGCKVCQRAYKDLHAEEAKKRRAELYPRYRETNRKSHLNRSYDMTPKEYQEMSDEQGNVCWICKQPETRVVNGRVCPLAVDHDHETNQKRGLLCNACNVGLSRFKDDPNLLLAAAAYIFASQVEVSNA